MSKARTRMLKALFPQFLRPEPSPGIETWEGWDRWEQDYRREHPVKHFVYWRTPILWGRFINRVRDGCWWVQHRVNSRHRYNLVDTGLPPGYYDYDERMLHACFALLSSYVESREPGFMATDFSGDEHQDRQLREMQELYRWWRDYRGHATRNPDQEQLQLRRLVDVRRIIWD